MKAKRRYKPKDCNVEKFATLDDCEIRYKLSKKTMSELANDVGALYRINGVVRIDTELLDKRLMDFNENPNPPANVWESDLLLLRFIKEMQPDLIRNVREAYLDANKDQIGEIEND
jgi:hypothetical protein